MNERDLTALAEKCGAEVGRYEGEVVWIKFHKPSIAPFAAALSQPHASAQEAAPSQADYEEALADHRRLVRELDVILNGRAGAAEQASLCDIVSQCRSMFRAPPFAVPHAPAPVQAAPTEPGRIDEIADWLDNKMPAGISLKDRLFNEPPNVKDSVAAGAWIQVVEQHVRALLRLLAEEKK